MPRKINKMTTIPSVYRTRYSSIPSKLFAYFDELLLRPASGSQFHRAMDIHPEATFRSLDRVFQECTRIVSLSPDDLLRKVDFNKNDLSPERIESLLGELLTILFLHEKGFTDIVPIRAGAKKSPDFSASAYGRNFLVEVVTSPHFAPRVFHESVVKWAIGRLKHKDKRGQFEGESGACGRMFVIVLYSSGAVALNQRSDYLAMVTEVWQGLGSQDNLFIALVTGRESLGEGPDDCVFPDIEGITRQ